ncbi:UNVERIFIED_CONTAM: hypothetical protein GTU68_041406 [Idotea baltica]|nr:hypothetical protein [Idotea baltica]MCL4120865.1 hypothetical protein [Idotea baltica]
MVLTLEMQNQHKSMAFKEKVLSLRFNQSHNCFICCLQSGVRVYNVEPIIEMVHLDAKEFGTMVIGEMLQQSNLLALVGGGSQPKYADNTVLIYDDDFKAFAAEYTYTGPVLALRVCKNRIIVALRRSVHVLSFPNHSELLYSAETGKNPLGLLELTPGPNCDRNIICFPAQKRGAVQIVDLATMDINVSQPPSTIYAHESEIACMSLSQDGTLLATASEKGTLIRVWDTIRKVKMAELRRGADPATLYCINFSGDNDFLCCSSDKGTVHIFALKDKSLNRRSTFSRMSFLGGYVESQWALANFTVPPESACVCAFGANSNVYAICYDGSSTNTRSEAMASATACPSTSSQTSATIGTCDPERDFRSLFAKSTQRSSSRFIDGLLRDRDGRAFSFECRLESMFSSRWCGEERVDSFLIKG